MLELVSDLFHQDESFGSQTHLTRVMKTPFDARLTAFGMSASSQTMKASDPPNSITVFLMTFPGLGGNCGARTHAPRYGSRLEHADH